MAWSRAEVEADIKETLGLVPSFFSRLLACPTNGLWSLSGRGGDGADLTQ
jgi:hypothetical protein